MTRKKGKKFGNQALDVEVLMYLYIRSEMEKMRCFTIFKMKVYSPLDPANPLYHKLILSIYTTYVSGKLGQWMDELGFYVPSRVFQSFRDDGRVNMKGSVQWSAV